MKADEVIKNLNEICDICEDTPSPRKDVLSSELEIKLNEALDRIYVLVFPLCENILGALKGAQ